MTDSLGRRGFLSWGVGRVADTATEEIDRRVGRRASRWIRPPFAVDELSFLVACSRCGECVSACPHEVVFELSPRLGPDVAATPALDLVNRGCHLCEDWPCVTVCQTGALQLPGGEREPCLPMLARVEVDEARCLPYLGPECGACEASCTVDGALNWQMGKPKVDASRCTGCAQCRESCVLEPSAITVRSLSAVASNEP